jgi:hypothetical protein
MRARIVRFGWPVWLLAVLVCAIPWFRLHLKIFRDIDPLLYKAALVSLAALAAGTFAYHRLRQRRLWRLEPLLVAGLWFLICAFYAPLATAAGLWICAAAYIAGDLALRRLSLQGGLALNLLAGFGLISCVLFLAGLAGALRTETFIVLLLLPLLFGWRSLFTLVGEIRSIGLRWPAARQLRNAHASIAVAAATLFGALTVVSTLTPAWNGDAIRMHLALVRSYLFSGSLVVPHAIPYGYFPQNYELLLSMAWALGGQSAAQMLNPVFFGISLALTWSIALRCGVSRSWAFAGIVLGATIPFLHWTGSAVKNDMQLVAYELGAFLCYLRWREKRNFRWILYGSFCLAMGFGVKHVVAFGAVPLLVLFAKACWQQPRRLLAGLQVTALLALFGTFWQLRTYLATGSPTYPLGTETAITAAYRKYGLGAQLLRYVRIPYSVHFQGKRHFESPSPSPAGITLMLAVPLLLVAPASARRRRRERAALFFILLYYFCWGWFSGMPRYAIAPILVLAVLAVQRFSQVRRWTAVTAVAAAFLFSFPVIVIMEMAPAQIPLFLKRIDAATFLRRTLSPYGAVDYLAHHASASQPIASVGDWAACYVPNPAIFEHVYRTSRVYSAADVRAVMKPMEPAFLILPNAPNLAELEQAAGTDHVLSRVYEDPDFVVIRLSPRRAR